MSELNFVAVVGDRLADSVSGISVIQGVFDQEANGVQEFVVFHDPKLVGRDPVMRIDEAPDYMPSDYRPSSFDPGAPTLFYSGDRRRLLSFMFHPWYLEGERLPFVLTLAPRREQAVAELATCDGIDDPLSALAHIIATTFEGYEPPMKREGVSRFQLVAREEDAAALYGVNGPILEFRHFSGVVVFTKDAGPGADRFRIARDSLASSQEPFA